MDGRTDGQEVRARHWKTAVYDSGEHFSGQFDALLNKAPSSWKVYTKLEICPTTQKEHYQTHVDCGRTERGSALSKWIKYTKWIPVKGDEHIRNSINYISKLETTAPGAKLIVKEAEKYYRLHELLIAIARSMIVYPPVDEYFDDGTPPILDQPNANGCKYGEQFIFKNAARFLIAENLIWIDKLSNPVVAKMWNDFGMLVRDKILEEILESGSPFIIEGEPDIPRTGVSAEVGYNFLDD